MKRHRFRAVVVCTLALLVAAPIAQAVVTPTKVLGGPGDKWSAYATDTWLVYTEWDREAKRSVAFAMRRSTGRTFRLNEAGTDAYTGGLVAGNEIAIFQQYTENGSTLFLYDLAARSRTRAPVVNSRDWEWDPRISKPYVSFFRDRYISGVWYTELLLHTRGTYTVRRIERWKDDAFFTSNGTIGERYVSWTRCRSDYSDCDVFVYDIVEREARKITGGGDKQEYAPVVDETAGLVYFSRSGEACGRYVDIWSIPIDHLGSTPTRVVSFPRGIDTGWTASLSQNEVTGHRDLWFEHWDCEHSDADVYRVDSIDLAV